MQIGEIQSFEDLKEFLASFSTWSDDQGYDCGGVIVLLTALLDNLRANEEEALDVVSGYLSDEQKEFLMRLAEQAHVEDDD